MTNLGHNMLETSTSTHVNKRPMTLWLRSPSLIFTQQWTHLCPAGGTHLREPVSWWWVDNWPFHCKQRREITPKQEWVIWRPTNEKGANMELYCRSSWGQSHVQDTLMGVSQMKLHLGATKNIASTKTTNSDFYIRIHKTSCVQLPDMIWKVTLSNICALQVYHSHSWLQTKDSL